MADNRWIQGYRDLLDALPAAVYTCDERGRVMLYNQAAVVLWGREPELGKDLWCGSWKIYRPDGVPLPLDQCPMAVTLSEGRAIRGQEIVVERPDGTKRHVLPHPEPMRNAAGAVVGAVNMLVDITDLKQADEALRRSERDLSDFFEHASIGIHWVGPDGIILRVNQTELDLLGYSREEYVGRHIAEFHVDQPVIQDILDRLVCGETLREYPARIRCKDGSVRNVLINSNVLFDDGKFIHTRCFTRDVTDLKRAKDALQANEERFRTLADNISQFAWMADSSGGLFWYNRRWYEYTGTTFEEMQGWGWEKVHHPDHLDRVVKNWRQAHDTGEPWEDTFPLRGRDGTYRWFLSRALPIRDVEGKVIRWFGTNTDVTEQRETEAALRQSEERYCATFANAAVGIAYVALDGRWLGVNDAVCRITGYAREELLRKPFADITHPDDIEPEWANARRLLAGETAAYSMEKRYIRKEGGLAWIHLTVSLQRDEAGSPQDFICIIEDITVRKQAETALRESEERLRSFAGQLEQLVEERTQELVQSHDRLRALATELNLAEQRGRKRLAGELHDYLAQLLVLCRLNLGQVRRAGLPPKAEEIVKETEEVLNKALNYSRTLMAELSPPILQEHGLPAGLKWLGEQMQRRGLTVTVDIVDAAGWSLPEDSAVLLFQSVRELLMNALKHADSKEVAVRLERGEGNLRIEVRDDGVGFDLAAATAAVATNPTAMSSKFGLFSIRERMTSLGGWFDLQSAPGQGTTAILALPLSGGAAASAELGVLRSELGRPEPGVLSDQARNSEPKTQHSNLHQRDAKIRVLLVDDHAMVRQGLRSVLDSYADIEVVGEAWNGEEAVALVERLQPALVVMDITMPKMNGIEATTRIKARYPHTIVIGLSVNAGGANEEAMKNAGAAMLLTKEAAVDELYRAIQETLGAIVMSNEGRQSSTVR